MTVQSLLSLFFRKNFFRSFCVQKGDVLSPVLFGEAPANIHTLCVLWGVEFFDTLFEDLSSLLPMLQKKKLIMGNGDNNTYIPLCAICRCLGYKLSMPHVSPQ